MERSRIGIVIPAFNESSTIENVVKATEKYGMPIVVDDGSTDNTPKIAIQAGAYVVSCKKNQGYDFALDLGFKKAAELGAEIIITIDADGQHDPSLIQKFIDKIDAGAEIVIGERNERQRFSEHIFAWYTKLCFKIEDPLCGMKAYQKVIYDSLGYFDSYGSIGTELMLFAVKNNFKFDQVLINVWDRKDQPRFGQYFVANYKILRAILFSFWRIKKI